MSAPLSEEEEVPDKEPARGAPGDCDRQSQEEPATMAVEEPRDENPVVAEDKMPTGKPEEPHANGENEEESLARECHRLRRELDEALSAAAVAEIVKESLVSLDRQKTSLQEELATMQQLLGEAHDEAAAARTDYEHRLAGAKAVIGQLEVENQELKIQLKVTSGSGGAGEAAAGVLDRDTLLGGAAVISDATKSFARRMKTNLLQTGVIPNPASAVDRSTVGVSGNSTSDKATIPHAASQPAGLLTLEDGMRRAHEDTELLKSIVVPLEEQIGALKDKLREADGLLREYEARQSKELLALEGLGHWLEDKASPEDAMAKLLELSGSEDLKEGRVQAQGAIYVALLGARYSLLNSELTSLRAEHAEVVELLDKERHSTRRLKHEATITGSHMLKLQREHLTEIARMHALLTEEQKEELFKSATSSDLSPVAATSPAKTPDSLSSSSSSSPVHSVSPSSDSSPTKKQLLENSGEQQLVSRLVSGVEWDSVQKELERVMSLLGVGSVGEGVVGSEQYRALQAELIEVKKQRAAALKQVEKLRAEEKEEDEFRRQLEDRWNERAEQHRTETEAVHRQLQEAEGLLEQLREGLASAQEVARRDLRRLGSDREPIVRELRRLQDEVDVLTGKHSAKAAEMQNEAINLPEDREEMQLLLLRLREDLIAAKVSAERADEKMMTEVGFFKKRLAGEEEERRRVEETLSVEIQTLKSALGRTDGLRIELDKERARRTRLEEGELRQQREALATARREAAAAADDRNRLETRVTDLRSRAANLQQELDNSMAVQTDFVKLSQSLQMELEKIRQSEKEVRWQHEDDFANCQNCQVAFSTPAHRRSKHHCRHCGRIFCSNCVSKHVPSGPRRRPAKVCDVCHTLLNRNSAPYFSTEAPQGST